MAGPPSSILTGVTEHLPVSVEVGALNSVAVVRDLAVTFRRDGKMVRAIRGVDLEIGRGEILGLVGESGSGKTVLGQTILGLIRPADDTFVTGTVLVEDLDLLKLHGEARRRLLRDHVGAVFQDPMTSLNPSMRIGEQIGEICDSEDDAVAALARQATAPDLLR